MRKGGRVKNGFAGGKKGWTGLEGGVGLGKEALETHEKEIVMGHCWKDSSQK